MPDSKRLINTNLEELASRRDPIYVTEGDTRGEFYRDYTRILHSNAYRRLKHKTQVFYNIDNDHVCTRMEHVQHVEAVSYSIAKGLGLDLELTRAIACGHDLGHAPFGHYGETVIDRIMEENLSEEYKAKIRGTGADAEHLKSEQGEKTGLVSDHQSGISNSDAGGNTTKKLPPLFWHEKNGLRFVDHIELLADPMGKRKNLDLTYAVRDGIVSHCGELDVNGLMPRDEMIDLNSYRIPGEYAPFTWEGCVVKIADKIAYLGRDIEDALTLDFLSEEGKVMLQNLGDLYGESVVVNTTSIMHGMIRDICENSSPECGITLSDKNYKLLCGIKKFNYDQIYHNPRFEVYKDYAELVLKSLFNTLAGEYDGEHTIGTLQNEYLRYYPKLTGGFIDWLVTYSDSSMIRANDNELIKKTGNLQNEKIYSCLENKDLYIRAIIDYISGMTDSYAITMFNELISFT